MREGPLFSKLIASDPGAGSWMRNPWGIGVSLLAHLLMLGGVVWAAGTGDGERVADDEFDPEEVTYVDVTEIPEPPEMESAPEVEEPEEPAPARQQPERAPAPRQPRDAPDEPTDPDEPAGFQELEVPEELSGIPEPGIQEPVSPEDVRGRGAPGGRAGGQPPEEAGGGAGSEGEGAGGGAGGEGTFVAATVDRQPELTNRQEIARMLQRLYPERLRDMGVRGRVVVQFVIDANGRVEMGSVRILSSSNDAFTRPARQVLGDMRFRPARVGGRNVRMLTQMPISFNVRQ